MDQNGNRGRDGEDRAGREEVGRAPQSAWGELSSPGPAPVGPRPICCSRGVRTCPVSLSLPGGQSRVTLAHPPLRRKGGLRVGLQEQPRLPLRAQLPLLSLHHSPSASTPDFRSLCLQDVGEG